MIQEFKDFIDKGGVFEAAVGLVLALAFVPVVDSIVVYLITPIVAAIFGEPDFGSLAIDIGDAEIGYGMIINAIITFVTIGFVLFLLVKAYNRANRAEEEEAGPTEVELLTEIRDGLRT